MSVLHDRVDPPVHALDVTQITPVRPHPVPALVIGTASVALLLKVIGVSGVLNIFWQARLVEWPDYLLLLGVLIVSMVVHELGHLAMAVSLGFDVLAVTLGPFRLSCLEDGWTVQFGKRSWLAASVSAIPRNRVRWRSKMLLVVGAGPVFTLLSAVVAILVLSAGLARGDGQAWALAAELNTILFLLGLVPNGPGAPLRNDAALLQLLIRNSPEARDVLLYHGLLQMQREGFRPGYYPEQVIRELAARKARPEVSYLFARAISEWALDRGNFATADAWDRRALDVGALCSPQYLNPALAQAACVDVIVRADFRSAVSKCEELDFGTLEPEWLRHRTQAVQKLSRQQVLEAVAALQQAEYALPSRQPRFEFERAVCKRLRQIALALSKADKPTAVL